MVRMLDMGADVALITVQVEIVTGIDCASKCYTSHSSFYPFIFLFFGGKKSSEHNTASATVYMHRRQEILSPYHTHLQRTTVLKGNVLADY